MDDNQDFHGKNPDLYEEVLVSESLDQYEGLLNHSKSTKKCPQGSTKGVKGPSSLDLNWIEIKRTERIHAPWFSFLHYPRKRFY